MICPQVKNMHSSLAVPHQWGKARLSEMFIVSEGFQNSVYFHDIERNTIRMAPPLVLALGIESQSLIKLLTRLRNDSRVRVEP